MTFPMWFSCSMEPQVWICYSYNRRRPGIPAPDTACLRELGWWDPTKQWLFVDRIGLGLLLNWFHRGGNFQWSWLIVYCFFLITDVSDVPKWDILTSWRFTPSGQGFTSGQSKSLIISAGFSPRSGCCETLWGIGRHSSDGTGFAL